MTLISARTGRWRYVSSRRLFETAVTPSDWSMQKAAVSEYDGSLPINVTSVPCSVVMMRGTLTRPEAARICRAR